MTKTPYVLLGLATLGLAGCDPYPPPPPSYPAAAGAYGPAAAPAAYGSAMVTMGKKAPYGDFLVDASGRALYILEGTRTPGGVNRCQSDCLRAWPPLIANSPPVAGSDVDSAKLATVPTPAGAQTTYGGWPLYYYHKDRAPGDTTGQHVTDRWGIWHLLALSGEPIRPSGGY